MSNALGLLTGNPTGNRSLSTFSSGGCTTTAANCADGPITANQVMFATAVQLALPTASRFVTFSVDASATTCGSAHPQLRFHLRNAVGTEIPLSTSAIDPCSDPRTLAATIDGRSARYGSFAANGSTLVIGNSVGIVLRNQANHSLGNDSAIDNIRVLDVTPQLDKAFVPALTGTAQAARLTFTVTNTSELAAKGGFSFTDNLPSGLVIAANPDFQSTCAPASITAGGTAGATAVSFQGSLANGQPSCTFGINVSAASEGTYTNAPGTHVTNLVGLDAPAPATLTVRDARLTLSKVIAAPGRFNAATDQFTMEIRQGTAAGSMVNTTGSATTAGSATAVTPGSGTTGPTTLVAGTTYHLLEAAAGTTDLAAYLRTITCTDSAGLQTGLPTNQSLATSFAINPVAGANISCTITNTSNRGQITIVKDAVPNDAQDFAFTTSGTGWSSFALDDDADPALPNTRSFTLAPGTYTVTETALAGWSLTGLSCSGDTDGGTTANLATATATIDLDANERIVCTYTNTRRQADLRVTKSASPAGSVPAGQTITYTIAAINNGPDAANGASIMDGPVSGLTCPRPGTTPSCTASGGATCPGSLAGLFTAPGVAVPTFPAGGSIAITLQCVVN